MSELKLIFWCMRNSKFIGDELVQTIGFLVNMSPKKIEHWHSKPIINPRTLTEYKAYKFITKEVVFQVLDLMNKLCKADFDFRATEEV